MEEDNAHDILKYVRSAATARSAGEVRYKGEQYNAKIFLHGNILCIESEEAHVPLIFVLERISLRRDEAKNNAVIISFTEQSEVLSITFSENENVSEKWLVDLATCSHAMVRAELDEIAYKFFTMSSGDDSTMASPDSPQHSFHNFYLTNPIRHTHNFAVSQHCLPARRLSLEEAMWESKLSLILPAECIKLYKKWTAEYAYMLESRQNCWPSFAIPALHEVLREVRDNAESYEQCAEFLAAYAGPPFRKSVEKHRVAFAPVPTNLHVQVFNLPCLNEKAQREMITSGTASTIPLRFTNGGLTRLLASLDLNSSYTDYVFWNKRKIVTGLKKMIGELSHKLDTEWKLASFGKPDKICIEINAGVKQVFEKLKDTLLYIPGIEQYAEYLVDEDRRRVIKGLKVSDQVRVPETIQNQIDVLDAMLISLQTKIAIIDTLNDDSRPVYEKSVRDAISSSLDMLLTLADTVLEAQLLGQVLSLHTVSTHTFFHIQLRSDFLISQVSTIAATAIMSRIDAGWPVSNTDAHDLLLVIFSFLSAYGDERGMAEDAIEAWRLLEALVEFRIVRAPSSVCRNCIPIVSGDRSLVTISLPLPHETYDNLPQHLKDRSSVRVRTAYFNIGVNHEATLAQSFGGLSFEANINQEASERVLHYANTVNCSTETREIVTELVNAVSAEPSRKNLSVYEWAMSASEALNGRSVVCCKSGKDRTGMAVTLEQGRVLRETCGLNAAQVSEAVSSLRRDGVRRENCRKNVGKAVYSFSPFQMHFLPKAFRPPSGTYAPGVAS